MAKASRSEWQKAADFVRDIDDMLQYDRPSDEELGRFVKENIPPLFRVVFGYQVLLDNCCDPTEETLEFHPLINDALEHYSR